MMVRLRWCFLTEYLTKQGIWASPLIDDQSPSTSHRFGGDKAVLPHMLWSSEFSVIVELKERDRGFLYVYRGEMFCFLCALCFFWRLTWLSVSIFFMAVLLLSISDSWMLVGFFDDRGPQLCPRLEYQQRLWWRDLSPGCLLKKAVLRRSERKLHPRAMLSMKAKVDISYHMIVSIVYSLMPILERETEKQALILRSYYR